jgi:signal transduction histidine kinase
LTEGAQVVGTGNLDYRVGTLAKDEIGELSRSFDRMTENLKETTVSRNELAKEVAERKRAENRLKNYSGRLEEMVDERTKELKGAQEELVRKEKLAFLGQLSGSVGHELRNPLGVISNAVYLLKMVHNDGDETTKEYLDIISSEVQNSEKIISDLLDFSRTRSPEMDKVHVSEIVDGVLTRRPSPNGVTITTEIAEKIPPVYVDPRQVSQVLDNLISNAYQAMPEGGELKIKAEEIKKKVSLSIMDTGLGISKENMKKLFEPLFTTRARGIGLGLSVSKGLIEANGGQIKVKSKEGSGSTFTLILPVREGGL